MTFVLSENIGKPLEYMTENQLGSGDFVTAKVTSDWIDTDMVPGLEFENADGYEWLGVSSTVISEQPCCWVLSYEDFYTSDQYDDREVECGVGEGFNYKKGSFSISCDGKDYEDCRMILIIPQPEDVAGQVTQEDAPGQIEFKINLFYRIPKGYDGCLLGFHNSSALTKEQIEMGMTNPAASLGFIKRTEGDLFIRIK